MSRICSTCSVSLLTYAEVEERTGKMSGEFEKFSGHMFDLYAQLAVDDALARLRTCWGGGTFDARIATHRSEAANWLQGLPAPEVVLSKTSVMVATSEQLDAVYPGKCASDGLVALDANHRLAALALRRSRGLRDGFRIAVYAVHACRAPDRTGPLDPALIAPQGPLGTE